MTHRRRWLAWEVEFLRCFYGDYFTEAIAHVLGRPVQRVLAKANGLGLKKSSAVVAEMSRLRLQDPDHGAHRSRFPKGHAPANKGMRRPGWHAGRMRETQFKKGRQAWEAANYRPIGSEKVCPKRGVLMRKMTDDPAIKPVKRWTPVHVLVWQAEHGPVPAGHIVRFRTGRKTLVAAEITADRLECVTLAENMARNTVHNLPPQLAAAVQLRGVLNRAINARTRKPS